MRQSGKSWLEGPSKEEEKTTPIIFVTGTFSATHHAGPPGEIGQAFFQCRKKNCGVSFSFP